MKTYIINKVDVANEVAIDSPLWDTAPEAVIDSYIWDEGKGYRPNTTVKLLAGKNGLSLLFCTDENPLTATYLNHNDDVWCDSCMEFFYQPDPEDPRYFNFEMNPFGKLLLGIGVNTHNRITVEYDYHKFKIQPLIKNGCWYQRLYIPFDFVGEHFNKVSSQFRGNLLKCGDKTPHAHYGTWSPIDPVAVPRPQFHLTEYFGCFIIE